MSQRRAASPLGRIFAYPNTLSTKNVNRGGKVTSWRSKKAHMMLTSRSLKSQNDVVANAVNDDSSHSSQHTSHTSRHHAFASVSRAIIAIVSCANESLDRVLMTVHRSGERANASVLTTS